MFTPSSFDPLTTLQLQIARRADELATSRERRSALNLSCWLQAEEEMLACLRGPASDGSVECTRPEGMTFASSGSAAMSMSAAV